MKYQVRNWSEFQHYKDRSPPWIKLHRALLNNREWHALSGDASKLLVECWLVASESDEGVIELSVADLAWRLRRQESDAEKWVQELVRLRFLVPCGQGASPMLATCSTETEGEREAEGETEAEAPAKPAAAKASRRKWRVCPDDWSPKPEHRALAGELRVDIDAELQKFRDHEFAKPKTDADRTFSNWLRNAPQFARNGNGRPSADDRVRRHLIEVQSIDLNGSRSVFDD